MKYPVDVRRDEPLVAGRTHREGRLVVSVDKEPIIGLFPIAATITNTANMTI